jgi:hypothetical protein
MKSALRDAPRRSACLIRIGCLSLLLLCAALGQSQAQTTDVQASAPPRLVRVADAVPDESKNAEFEYQGNLGGVIWYRFPQLDAAAATFKAAGPERGLLRDLGVRPMMIDGEVTDAALPKDFPNLIAFVRKSGNAWHVFCHATAVADRTLVTSAHCVKDVDRSGIELDVVVPDAPTRKRVSVTFQCQRSTTYEADRCERSYCPWAKDLAICAAIGGKRLPWSGFARVPAHAGKGSVNLTAAGFSPCDAPIQQQELRKATRQFKWPDADANDPFDRHFMIHRPTDKPIPTCSVGGDSGMSWYSQDGVAVAVHSGASDTQYMRAVPPVDPLRNEVLGMFQSPPDICIYGVDAPTTCGP